MAVNRRVQLIKKGAQRNETEASYCISKSLGRLDVITNRKRNYEKKILLDETSICTIPQAILCANIHI